MSRRTDEATLALIIRTLDAWLLLNPELTIEAVTIWLESVNVEVVDPVLEAQFIDETK